MPDIKHFIPDMQASIVERQISKIMDLRKMELITMQVQQTLLKVFYEL